MADHMKRLGPELEKVLEAISDVDELASQLVLLPEENLWTLVRDCLLALQTRVGQSTGREAPVLRSIGYLYSLVRFVESAQRFPSKAEQGELLELSFSTNASGQIDPVSEMLRKASETPKSRKARRQLRERARKYRG